MKLVFFANKNLSVGKQLWELNNRLEPQYRGTFHETINELTKSLIQPKDDLNIVVLLATSREDLRDLIAIEKLLSDFRIILILPDRYKVTISMGHKLYPRFLSYADSDFNDVALVLNKMIENYNPEPFLQTPIKEAQHGH